MCAGRDDVSTLQAHEAAEIADQKGNAEAMIPVEPLG
jgi:hypothetical protein